MAFKDKDKGAKYYKQYRKDHKEEDKKYFQQYYLDNKEHKQKLFKQWRENNFEKTKRKNLKRKYNLSLEDWLKMWGNQDGRCAICGRLFIKPSDGFVDHNHKTGKIRGLLCRNCNTALGYFNDDPKLMRKAIEYLELEGSEL